MKTRPSEVSVKWSEQASMRRQIVNSLTPAVRAASSTVAISTALLHSAHHSDSLSARLRKMKVRSVSAVNFTMRFAFVILPPAGGLINQKSFRPLLP
ncbi:MAG: hypothetical protein H0U18_06055 [Pyrinomonadaceae bacterium]|nr:hypothetical protein [Pyrinomonadaceae bacterium]